MSRGTAIRFSIAVGVQLFCFAAFNLFGDWTLEMMPIKFVGVALVAGFAYLIASSNFAYFAGRKVAVLFWAIAILLRVFVIALPPSDDLWRFIWDGKVQSAAANPYLVAPDDAQLAALRDDNEDWGRIRNANQPSTFAPGAELIFRAIAATSQSRGFWKIEVGLADLGVAGLLLLIFSSADRYQRAAWYAWNPLVAYSYTGAAHFDSVMLLALTAAILFLVRNERTPSWAKAIAAALCFGVAIAMNFVAALLFLPFIFALRKRAITLILSAAIPLALALPFGFPRLSLYQFAGDLRFTGRLNDLFWWLIEETKWPNPHQRNFSYIAVLVAAAAIVSIACWRNWRRGMLWALGVTLLLMPVLNAWYCVWILPIATWRRSYAWHVLSVTVFAYYLFWNERLFRLPWHAEPWMRGIIIIPPLIAAASALRRPQEPPEEPGATEKAEL